MNKVTLSLLATASTFVFAGAVSAQAVSLNEVVANDTSSDDMEFVELCGTPGTDLSGYTLVVIEGEGTAMGTIDVAQALSGVIPADGFFVIGDAAVSPDLLMSANWIENGGETVLLVQNFTGSQGMDIDAENDCVADGPIGTVVDAIGFARPSQGDCGSYYGALALGPDTGDSGTADFDVAGAARCTDCDGDWGMICLAGTEPATDPGCDTNNAFNPYVVSFASPGTQNLCGPVSVESSSWG
ncbi:MAG: hypothetical protein KC591_15200, partial [Gemmatimonadetes bacterium]|nr:hypothetical protein [Gemmatimonadota bacterium]